MKTQRRENHSRDSLMYLFEAYMSMNQYGRTACTEYNSLYTVNDLHWSYRLY